MSETAETVKGRLSDKWIIHTQHLLAGCLVEQENFLVAFGLAAMQPGITDPMQALDLICKHYRQTVPR